MSRCSRRFARAAKVTVALASLAVGIAGVVLMPLYRWYCTLLAIVTVVVFFQLWQFAPCDKARVRRIAALKERQAVLRTSRRYQRRIDFLQVELDEMYKKVEHLLGNSGSTSCSERSSTRSSTISSTLSDLSNSTSERSHRHGCAG